MKIIAIANQKGGVCKTTTATALGQGLIQKGYKVLFVDLDPQGNLTYQLKADTQESPLISDVLEGKHTAGASIQTTADKWQIIGSDYSTSNYMANTAPTTLKKRLEPLKNKFDYIIIDTPPTLSALTINALVTADKVIIPTTAGIYSAQGIIQLHQTIEKAKELNPEITLDGILLTKYTDRSVISRQLKKALIDLAKSIDTKVYKTTIRQTVSVEEAQATQQALFTYAPRATATADYKNFIKEFLKGDK